MNPNCTRIGQISEQEVCITEYLGDHKGFLGIIKQRFSDFHVNEISSSDNIVQLTNTEAISVPSISNAGSVSCPAQLTEEKLLLLQVLSGQKHPSQVKPLAASLKDKGESSKLSESLENVKEVCIDVTGLSKEERTAIHKYVKSSFPQLNSTTQDIDERKFITATKFDNFCHRGKRSAWPASQSYTTFVLYKENIDTIEAINSLAGRLRLKPGNFSYAGTKDKRAKTSQLVSIHQVAPKNLFEAAKGCRGIHVGNFHYNAKPQKLGQLQGNVFKIALREIDGDVVDIEDAVESLKTKGFINYFGLQRFGSTNVPTHHIGKELLLEQWQKAVDLILHPQEGDSADLKQAKAILRDKKDAKRAFEALKFFSKNSNEGRLIGGLSQHGPKDLVNALAKIPRNMRLLYIHAYQSYLWNDIVSRRIRKYKLDVLPGDLVRKRSFLKKTGTNISDNHEDVIEDPEDDNSKESEKLLNLSKTVHILKEEETHLFDISEVLMPLPGYGITYPGNEMHQWYEESLQRDNLSTAALKTRVKEYSLVGAYRNIIVRSKSIVHKICFYNDPLKPLIQSDFERVQKIVADEVLSEGKSRALILEFDLPPSAYATMALRELMKIDSATKFHSELNSRKREAEENPEAKRIKL